MQDDAQNRDRALAAWDPIRTLVRARRRWSPPSIREGPWGGAGIAAVWPLSQVMAAVLDLRMLDAVGDDEVSALADILERYRDGDAYDPFPGDRPRYYDDNAWVGLDHLQRHLISGERRHLDEAVTVARYLRQGEHTDGGVYWVERPRRSRNTCSTAPAGELAARLGLVTGDDDALAFARRCADFLTANLRRDDGLYADNLSDDGTVDHAVYSYNQGTPVGLDVLLHRVTGERAPLERAQQSAYASLEHFATDDRLWAQAPCFNAIYFHNLLTLDAVSPNPGIRRDLSEYTERLWIRGRQPQSGWFTEGGIGAYERGGALDQAGIVQLFAMQAMPAPMVAGLC